MSRRVPLPPANRLAHAAAAVRVVRFAPEGRAKAISGRNAPLAYDKLAPSAKGFLSQAWARGLCARACVAGRPIPTPIGKNVCS